MPKQFTFLFLRFKFAKYTRAMQISNALFRNFILLVYYLHYLLCYLYTQILNAYLVVSTSFSVFIESICWIQLIFTISRGCIFAKIALTSIYVQIEIFHSQLISSLKIASTDQVRERLIKVDIKYHEIHPRCSPRNDVWVLSLAPL